MISEQFVPKVLTYLIEAWNFLNLKREAFSWTFATRRDKTCYQFAIVSITVTGFCNGLPSLRVANMVGPENLT